MVCTLSEPETVKFVLMVVVLISLQVGKKDKEVAVCAGYPVLLPDSPKYYAYLFVFVPKNTQNICKILTDLK